MKQSTTATSIVEAMVVLLIVVSGITGVYWLMNSSQKLANATGKRIEAIQIARDGLEAITNIRDSNWIKFSADYTNCWNTLNYDSNCIGWGWTNISAGSYIIYKSASEQFELLAASDPNDYRNATYRNTFAVKKDTNGFYTQTGSIHYWVWTTPFYTRELVISYPSPEIMHINSIVQWNDPSKELPWKLEISTQLSNWKAKK